MFMKIFISLFFKQLRNLVVKVFIETVANRLA
jgi:hypothetical protein